MIPPAAADPAARRPGHPPAVAEPPDEVATWQVTADGEPVTVRSRAGPLHPPAHPLPRPVRAVHVSLAGSDHVTELDVVPSSDPILFFSEDGRHLPARLPLPPDQLWILRPADRELIAAGELRMITERPSPPVGRLAPGARLPGAGPLPGAAGRPGASRAGHPRPRLLLGEPLPGVTTPDGSPVYPEPPRLWLPERHPLACRHPPRRGRHHPGLQGNRPGRYGRPLGRRAQAHPGRVRHHRPRSAGPQPPRDDLRRRRRSVSSAPPTGPRGPGPARPGTLRPSPSSPRHRGPGLAGPGRRARRRAAPPARRRARPLASGAETSSGQLTIRGACRTEGLAVALYLARAPWRAPVVVRSLPTAWSSSRPRSATPVRSASCSAPRTRVPVNWPDWPGRDAFACAAPGLPASSDLEEDALSRFLAGERDLPMRPRRVEHLWRLLHLAGDLIAAGAPADLRERCSAALATSPAWP